MLCGILASFPIPTLTTLTSTNDAECTECIAPAEKELLQSSGHIQSKMSGAEEGAVNFASHEIEENSNLVESRANVSEIVDLDSESAENFGEKWETQRKPEFAKGPSRRRFVIALYPGPDWGITTNTFVRGGRRRHPAITKRQFTTGVQAGKQDMYWDGKRIKNDYIQKCLDCNEGHEDTLYWHSCHNGGNQEFWKERKDGDSAKNAYHIVIGGDMGRRRRKSCVDYGGGDRFYIKGCHNGDNQRFKFYAATTTTSTTIPKPTPEPTLAATPEPTLTPTPQPTAEPTSSIIPEASSEPEAHCPWDMTHGHGCHRESNQKAKCKDGTFSFACIAEGRGERQQCPCTLPYMCAIPQCGDGQDYCCEKSCEEPKFGGIRPCNGKPEAEPTGEPVVG